MNVLVLSDTHMPARARAFPAPLVAALAQADLILHAGDLATLAILDQLSAFAPTVAVAGNVDGPEVRTRLPRRAIVPVGQFRIGLVHGDGLVRTPLAQATASFAGESVDCVVFGHSHVPLSARRDGRLFLNPGSPTDKRRQPRFSFAWLRAGESLDPEIVYY